MKGHISALKVNLNDCFSSFIWYRVAIRVVLKEMYACEDVCVSLGTVVKGTYMIQCYEV